MSHVLCLLILIAPCQDSSRPASAAEKDQNKAAWDQYLEGYWRLTEIKRGGKRRKISRGKPFPLKKPKYTNMGGPPFGIIEDRKGELRFSEQLCFENSYWLTGQLTCESESIARGDLFLSSTVLSWLDYTDKIGEVEVRRVTGDEFALVVKLIDTWPDAEKYPNSQNLIQNYLKPLGKSWDYRLTRVITAEHQLAPGQDSEHAGSE